MLNWSASPTKKVKYKERKRKTEKQSESGATKGKNFWEKKKNCNLVKQCAKKKGANKILGR